MSSAPWPRFKCGTCAPLESQRSVRSALCIARSRRARWEVHEQACEDRARKPRVPRPALTNVLHYVWRSTQVAERVAFSPEGRTAQQKQPVCLGKLSCGMVAQPLLQPMERLQMLNIHLRCRRSLYGPRCAERSIAEGPFLSPAVAQQVYDSKRRDRKALPTSTRPSAPKIARDTDVHCPYNMTWDLGQEKKTKQGLCGPRTTHSLCDAWGSPVSDIAAHACSMQKFALVLRSKRFDARDTTPTHAFEIPKSKAPPRG